MWSVSLCGGGLCVKTRIATSLIIIALASALAGAAAYAIFTHRSAEDGDVPSGSLEFVLVDEPLALSGMKPGDKRAGYVEIANTGPSDMIFRAYIMPDALNTDGFADQLQLRVILNPDGYISGVYGSYTGYGPPNTPVYEGALSSLFFPGLDNESAAFEDPPRPLRPECLAVYRLEITLPLDIEVRWENATFEGTLIVEGTPAGYQTPGSVQY